MKAIWKRVGITIVGITSIISMSACANRLDKQIPTQSVTAEQGDGMMLYQDEELGISFRVSEALYTTLLCEISPQETDSLFEQEKIVASFYGEVDQTRVPLFHISIYEGGFNADYIKEKAPEMIYLGSQNGFTYTMEYEDNETTVAALGEEIKEINQIGNKITVKGVAQGIFLDEKAGEKGQATRIEYSQEKVTQEDIETETLLATVNSQLGYQLQYYSDFFNYSNEENKEIYLAKNKDGEVYPNIYFQVTKQNDTTAQDVVNSLMEAKEGSSKKKTQIGNPEAPYSAIKIKSVEGTNANSIVTESYVIEDDTKVYVLELSYFKEGEEVYNEKLDQMLTSFVLV